MGLGITKPAGFAIAAAFIALVGLVLNIFFPHHASALQLRADWPPFLSITAFGLLLASLATLTISRVSMLDNVIYYTSSIWLVVMAKLRIILQFAYPEMPWNAAYSFDNSPFVLMSVTSAIAFLFLALSLLMFALPFVHRLFYAYVMSILSCVALTGYAVGRYIVMPATGEEFTTGLSLCGLVCFVLLFSAIAIQAKRRRREDKNKAKEKAVEVPDGFEWR